MKKTVILASLAALIVSCGKDKPSMKDATKDDISGHTLTMKSGTIKGLTAKFAGDNVLKFNSDNSFELIEEGDNVRSCTDSKPNATKKDQVVAKGSWDFNADKELKVTISTIESYAVPFVSKPGDSFTMTDIKKDDPGTSITGKIDTLYNVASDDACKDLKTGATNIKQLDGSGFKLSFTSESNSTSKLATILMPDDLYSTTAGSTWKLMFTKSTGDTAVTKATFAANNLLTFLKGADKKLVYVQAGTARACIGAPKVGKRLIDKDAKSGTEEFKNAPVWDVDNEGNLTFTIKKANYGNIAYLLPFAATPTTADSLTITIKACKIDGDKITGTMDTIYDLSADPAGTGDACTVLNDANLTPVTGVTVTLEKQAVYNTGIPKDKDFLANVIDGKSLTIAKLVNASDTTDAIAFLADNPLVFSVDNDKNISWTYTEGNVPYTPGCIDSGLASGAKGPVTKAKSILSKGTATISDIEGDAIHVKLVLSVTKVTAGTGGKDSLSLHPYLVPLSNVDPTANGASSATVTMIVPKVVKASGDFGATMDYYAPPTGDSQCVDNNASPPKKIAKSLVGESNSTENKDANVIITME